MSDESEMSDMAEAIACAANGHHQGWRQHDQQNGHVTPDWQQCPTWPCSTLAALSERGYEVVPKGGLDVERLARATASVVGWSGPLDFHREWATKVAREYEASDDT